jgi:hypothetical protein
MSFISDFTVAVAAIVTATAAWKGLSSWKLEQAGKVHFEVARQLARATYRLRNAMNDARAVFTSAAEFPEGYNSVNRTDREEAEAWAHIFKNRFTPLREVALELQTVGLEAEVLWGEEVKQKVAALLRCVSLLRAGMERRIRQLASGDPRRPDQLEAYTKTEDIVFGSTEFADIENPFTDQVRVALGDMQDFLKAHLTKFRLDG